MRKIDKILSIFLVFTFIVTILPVINVQAIEMQSNTLEVVEQYASMHLVMGKGSLSKEKMMTMLKKQNPSLSDKYISDYVGYVIKEANDEGVNYDVVFGLTMLETNYLRFGGDVKANQNNFGGMGATGNGAPGLSFPTVEIGVRAVVQHLKAYGSTQSLNKECVDPRFKYVERECAKYVEWLGIQENPNHKGWASGANYGSSILRVIDQTSAIVTYEGSKIKDVTITGTKQVDSVLTIVVSATPESETLYRYVIYDKSTKKAVYNSNWTNTNSLKYLPKKTGNLSIKVYTKNKQSMQEYDSDKTVDISIVDFQPIKISDFVITGGEYAGEELNIKTIADIPKETLYRYTITDKATGKCIVKTEWSTDNKYTYKTDKAGEIVVNMYVKNKKSKNDFDTYKSVTHKVKNYGKASITEIKVNDIQQIGKEMKVDTIAEATPQDSILYRYEIKEQLTGKTVYNGVWNRDNSCKYTPAKEGDYTITVYVKNKLSDTSTYDDAKIKKITAINYNQPKIVDYTLNGSGKAGEKLTLTLRTTVTEDILYKFAVYDNSANKNVYVADWSSSNTLTWYPQAKGSYLIVMYVKNKASTFVYDDIKTITKDIQPVKSAISSIVVSGEQKSGHAITIKVNATPSTNNYYTINVINTDTKEIMQLINKQMTNEVKFTPTKPGNYQIKVMIKSKYSDAECDDTETKDIKIASSTLIVLDPGHGGSDPGAGSGKYVEKSMNLTLALNIRKELLASGYDVVMTRITDVYVELTDRAMIANNKNADLFISVHHNSFTSSSAHGTEVYYTSNQMDSDIRNQIISQGKKDPNTTHSSKVTESKKLSDKFAPLLASATGLTNRGSKDASLSVNRNTYMPAILLEAGFVTNVTDAETVSKTSVQENIGKNLATAIKACGY